MRRVASQRIDGTLTAEQLRAALDYDPATGLFRWRHRLDVAKKVNSRWAGKVAGCPDGQYGYTSIRVNNQLFQAHRLAWLWMTGNWPANLVDHIDMNPANNAWSNLRAATKSQNMMNQGIPRHNSTGYKGVTWNGGAYVAQIMVNHRAIVLGRFPTAEAAHAAYCEAAAKLHGEFARTG